MRYGMSYAAIFFVMGVLGPFFSLFLNGQGFDASAIGFMLALGGPIRVIASPLMGWVADAGMPLRWLAGLAQTIAAFCLLTMTHVTAPVVMALLVVSLYAAHGPLSAMIDASVSHSLVQRRGLNYARIRLWGSLAFIAGNLCGGFVADRSAMAIALLAAAGLCAGAFLSSFLPDERRIGGSTGTELSRDGRGARWGLIALFIGAAAAIQASHSAIYTIGALAWRAQGLSQTTTGVMWMIGVVVEVILFLRIGQAVSGRQRAMLFIGFGGVLAVLRWLIMATEPGLPLTFLCQLMHGLTFGATHLGLIAALAALSPDRYRSRIQGASAAIHAVSSSTAVYFSGVLFQSGGASAAYGLMAVYAACGVGAMAMLFAFGQRAQAQ